MKKLTLAIIGQGRSGRDIHGAYLRSEANTRFLVKYIVEQDADRRKRAEAEYPGCIVLKDYKQLLDIQDIDFVVNASFSDMHYEITRELLKNGKNVLCEKPFARTRFECEDLIRIAKENNVLVTVFHQSLMAPFYMKVKEILQSGVIGTPKIVNLRYNNFARRWDWQTLQKRVAGSVYNTGPHPIGIGMDLMGFDPNIRVAVSYLDCALTSGDGEDIAKIILTAPGRPLVDIEINSVDPYTDYNLKIQGTRGTVQAGARKCKVKYVADGENPSRPIIEEPLQKEDGTPAYCGEQLKTHEEEYEISASVFVDAVASFYENLYDVIENGRKLYVNPENIAQLIGVIEAVHAQNPLPVKF